MDTQVPSQQQAPLQQTATTAQSILQPQPTLTQQFPLFNPTYQTQWGTQQSQQTPYLTSTPVPQPTAQASSSANQMGKMPLLDDPKDQMMYDLFLQMGIAMAKQTEVNEQLLHQLR